MNKFWGLISEQSIESLHRRINEDEELLCRINDRDKIINLLIRRTYVRNCVFDMNIPKELLFDSV